jgi:hypothetical protein
MGLQMREIQEIVKILASSVAELKKNISHITWKRECGLDNTFLSLWRLQAKKMRRSLKTKKNRCNHKRKKFKSRANFKTDGPLEVHSKELVEVSGEKIQKIHEMEEYNDPKYSKTHTIPEHLSP